MKKYIFGALLSTALFACSDSDDTWKEEDGNNDTPENVEYATDETVYEIPVVFHVFYSQKSQRLEYVEEGHLPKVLEAVNRRFANCGVDLKLQFKLAEVDPEGNAMPEPGVDRQKLRFPA